MELSRHEITIIDDQLNSAQLNVSLTFIFRTVIPKDDVKETILQTKYAYTHRMIF